MSHNTNSSLVDNNDYTGTMTCKSVQYTITESFQRSTFSSALVIFLIAFRISSIKVGFVNIGQSSAYQHSRPCGLHYEGSYTSILL